MNSKGFDVFCCNLLIVYNSEPEYKLRNKIIDSITGNTNANSSSIGGRRKNICFISVVRKFAVKWDYTGRCGAFDEIEDPLDPGALCDVVPIPPDKTTGDRKNDQDRNKHAKALA